MSNTTPKTWSDLVGRSRSRGGRVYTSSRGRASTERATDTRWRGRGAAPLEPTSRRGDFQNRNRKTEVEPLEAQAKGDLLGSIDLEDVKWASRSDVKAPTIQDCEFVASYNLLHRRITTILVPGKLILARLSKLFLLPNSYQGAPRAWTPPIECPELRQDRGHFFKDVVEARWPDFPLEPGIRAVFQVRPEFEGSEIDLVSCATVLENLLRFLTATERSFRFDVELVGETAFFVSKGTSPKEGMVDVRGYGHTYPEAYTKWDGGLHESLCHQRLIKYRFGNVKCLVQFKADGYLKDKVNDKNESTEARAASSQSSLDAQVSSLLTQTEAISLSSKAPLNQSDLRVEACGKEIPQNSVFELKTRSTRNENVLDPILLRLWLTQITNLILARHTFGKFEDASPQDMSSDVHAWEKKYQRLLESLHKLLRRLIDSVTQSKDQKVEVRRIGEGPLEIRQLTQSSWSALPPDLKSRWKASSDAESEDEGGDDYLKF